MTDADLDRIEEKLEITLPGAYRELLLTRAEELKGLTHEIRGKTYGWFDELLYLDADTVIETNLSERQPDAGTEYAFPDWSETFFLIGSDGAGGYYCLRLVDDWKVWMIGSDCGNVPRVISDSLSEFVNEEVERHRNEPPWQPPAVLSSFDDSCPLLERFSFFIGQKACEIECQDGDRPLTAEKLRRNGIDIDEVGRCAIRLISVLAKYDASEASLVIESRSSSTGSLMLSFGQVPMGDSRFQSVGANIFKGNVHVSLHGPLDKAPAPENAGIDWTAFRLAVTSLLETVSPWGTLVTVSETLPGQFSRSDRSELWSYHFTYSLE